MAELDDFAERMTSRLLDQLKADHAEAALHNAQFREEIRSQVSSIRESLAALIARECAAAKRIGDLEDTQRAVTGRLIGLLLGLLGSAGAAIWGLIRER